MKKIAIIDNYDSFTYNLKHLIEDAAAENTIIIKNDSTDMSVLEKVDFIFISPGPGLPEEAGKTLEVIRKFGKRKKIFGVCLGLQAIAVSFGGSLTPLKKVRHGIQSEMHYTDHQSIIFNNIPDKFLAGRYHSWVADELNFPTELRITQKDIDGNIMALEHVSLPMFAVQYHPESIMTQFGLEIISNFLKISNH